MEACKEGAILFTQRGREIDWNKCNQCLECTRVCPSKAIECVGQYMTVDEVIKKIEDDRTFYKNSNGGMTISGGEALAQSEFAFEVFKRSQEKGIHTALDTTANASWTEIEKVINYIDLVLVDIKHMDSKMHKKGTGVGNEVILENVKKIAARVKTWIRIPLIPHYNDSESNLKKVAEFALAIGAEKVSLLPYHELGSSKYPKLGKVYSMEATKPPKENRVTNAKKLIQSIGLNVEIGR
jgi:pyruvate formate lyase activating enzyme